MRAIMNWSGGKDATLALYKLLQQGHYEVPYLFTTVSSPQDRITMHGVRQELLQLQAESIGIELRQLSLPSSNEMETYNQLMQQQMQQFTTEDIYYSIFGDIYLQDLRTYREQQLQKVGMQGVFPLWQLPTTALLNEFLALGFRAVVVCVNAKYLDESHLGQVIDQKWIASLLPEVDICGENGEFHTFVFDGPLFDFPIDFRLGEIVTKDYGNGEKTNYDSKFHFIDLEVA